MSFVEENRILSFFIDSVLTDLYPVYRPITAGTLVPSSVNGDIAIQSEWSNFDPSQDRKGAPREIREI